MNSLLQGNKKMNDEDPTKLEEGFIKVIWETIFNNSKYFQETSDKQ
jgi:hypothetical protein